MMKAKDGAVRLSRVSEILLEATMLMVSSQHQDSPPIGQHDRREIPKFNLDWLHSGWCNNLQRPEFGSAFQPLLHLLPPQYDDGINVPRSTSSNGTPLPNPRVISNIVHHEADIEHQKYSHMIMQFGQFIAHDITHSPLDIGTNGEALNCSRRNRERNQN
ncbi:hypothetical protein DICVIV_03157 [Dictyocaulus viviparus]|uniref:Animal hem peroxidase n=1 Tax=Dictyocaulus viviparus TaxID=29172 RepID=A0A0D8Y822_DICVI|nr:hypothetical protein DICVIV_03157 [Dictyocaulus viviparus]